MRRMLTIVAATAVAAAVAIPALAQEGGGQDRETARYTACLTAHGVAVPAGLGGRELKQWLAEHQGDAAVGAAMDACAGPDHGAKIAQLRACLSSHGVDTGSGPDALKRAMLELSGTAAGRATLAACGTTPATPDRSAAGKASALPPASKQPAGCAAKS